MIRFRLKSVMVTRAGSLDTERTRPVPRATAETAFTAGTLGARVNVCNSLPRVVRCTFPSANVVNA